MKSSLFIKFNSVVTWFCSVQHYKTITVDYGRTNFARFNLKMSFGEDTLNCKICPFDDVIMISSIVTLRINTRSIQIMVTKFRPVYKGKRRAYTTQNDDVIKWKPFPRYWPFVRGIHRSPMNSLNKGQWREALMFSMICAWTNGWVNNREAGDLRRHRCPLWRHFNGIFTTESAPAIVSIAHTHYCGASCFTYYSV